MLEVTAVSVWTSVGVPEIVTAPVGASLVRMKTRRATALLLLPTLPPHPMATRSPLAPTDGDRWSPREVALAANAGAASDPLRPTSRAWMPYPEPPGSTDASQATTNPPEKAATEGRPTVRSSGASILNAPPMPASPFARSKRWPTIDVAELPCCHTIRPVPSAASASVGRIAGSVPVPTTTRSPLAITEVPSGVSEPAA